MNGLNNASTSHPHGVIEEWVMGENIWMSTDNKMDKTDAAVEMVWQKSLVIGCAAVSCDTMTLIGCTTNSRIMPATSVKVLRFRNTVGALIYDVGEPCTTK
ncbi:hypothetical protein OSTOST_20828 [Ostertagia ostertagi]